VLQETVASFEVRCCASQLLHKARRCVHSCVQAAAAARVAGGPDIFDFPENLEPNLDGGAVVCQMIADADFVHKRSAR
jgi:hypothetical protein